MWNEIIDELDLRNFMDEMILFHDSCIKELRYISGAYVDNELAMYPINHRRILSVIVQRQFENNPMIEMEFKGLKFLKLFPVDEEYTCEIFDSLMFFKDDCIYWCDCRDISEDQLDDYEGVLICASKLRWRAIDNCMGDKEFYIATK